jgi:molybdopterin-guanine dinucleotide biosynthesis protein A/alpha-beta hydrolase superfamily lysophospholipase
LHVEESGPPDAPLVVLVHGSMDRATGMAKVARRLQGTARVLRYDRRGYARSRPHPGPFGMDEQVADLVALLEGRPAVLVGHSLGGNIVLAAAERHPELVRAVAVYEPPLSWEPWWPSTSGGSVAVREARTAEDAAELFLRYMLGDERWERLPERTRAERRAEGPALVGELRSLRRGAPWHAARIHAPVVAGVGERARRHHREAVRAIAEQLPDARAVVVPGAGHGAHASHPDEFVELLVQPALATGRARGFVLAGGASRRMGRDKAAIEVGGTAMVARVASALAGAGTGPVSVVGGDRAVAELAGAAHLADRWPGEGPLGGVITALGSCDAPMGVVAACDLPSLDAGSVGRLVRALDEQPSAGVAVAVDGQRHWTCAAWRVDAALGVLEAAFAAGERSIQRAAAGLAVAEVTVGQDVVHNVNRPEDLVELEVADGDAG